MLYWKRGWVMRKAATIFFILTFGFFFILISSAAENKKKIIDSWKPDIVITSEGNALKYLISHYFKGKEK